MSRARRVSVTTTEVMDTRKVASNQINRRTFFSVTGGAVAVAAAARADTGIIAKTTDGQVRGASADGVILFKGIPYAGSAAGENRFKAPPKLSPWMGVRDALVYGEQAIQPPDPNWPKSEERRVGKECRSRWWP